MLQPCLIPFQKKKNQNRWTQPEFCDLIRIVKELHPEDADDWRHVCMQMHQTGSRRRPCDYKGKYLQYENKLQGIQLKLNEQTHNQVIKQIMRLFQKGKNPNQISLILTNITTDNVRKTITNRLSAINKIISKIVGKRSLKELKVKDHHLYGFISKNNLQVDSLDKIQKHCMSWKVLKLQKDKFQNQNPIKYSKIKQSIQQKLTQFNNNLINYSNLFQSHLQNKPKILNIINKNSKSSKFHSDKSPTVPFRHLSEAAQQGGQIKQLSLLQNQQEQIYQQLKLCHQRTMNSISEEGRYGQSESRPQFQFRKESINHFQEQNFSYEHEVHESQLFLPKSGQNFELSFGNNYYFTFNQNFDSQEYFS